jgi:hypothetical protein
MAQKKPRDMGRAVRGRQAGARSGEAERQGKKSSSEKPAVTDPRRAHGDMSRVQDALKRSDPNKVKGS